MAGNFRNYSSPYAKPLQQEYPSQSEDYLSFNYGGPTPPQQQQPDRQRHSQRFQEDAGNAGGGYGRNFGRGRGGRFTPNKYQNHNRYDNVGTPGQDEASNTAVPYFYRDPNAGGGFGQRGGGGGGNNNHNQQRQNYNNHRNNRNSFGGGGGRGSPRFNKHQQRHNNDSSAADYFHPSMLEDPWQELMERLEALRKSELASEKRPCNEAASDSEGGALDDDDDLVD